ncbi:transmembrane protein 185B [Chrysoperla carnea]|uniref:transmembrane protein 185B n=1 Tax=Chrysoperla carnea TaxID=189513 RepID=UPI001D0747DA|nr:transmembrane protein 185B [Chrysoperla carnea]
MNLQTLCQDFNPSKFVVHNCLLLFTTFFALRRDNYINWSYWNVFLPLWIWKLLVILGAVSGSIVWWQNPHYRLEGEAYIQYKSMLISLALHLILLMFELLVCDKLETGRHLWILVFIPLIFISIVSIAVCIWAVKHDRSFELELFCAVNILQFIFLALKLDGFISWTWEVVFVPLWIIMCLSLVGVLYTIIFAGILLRTPEVNAQQRRSSFNSALGYTFLVIPILIFQVLLTNRLDGEISINYITVVSPLFVSFFTLILMSFNAKGCNRWWFGIRKDFCQFLLGTCPLLQEYGNIAYSIEDPNMDNNSASIEMQPTREKRLKKCDLLKPVVPITSIDMPD